MEQQQQQQQQDLPVTQKDDFIAAIYNSKDMDMSKLTDKQFIVAVSTGDRNRAAMLPSTIRGPYSFYEMVEQVGVMWDKERHHPKVTILSKDFNEPVQFIDSGTIEFIEMHYKDLIMDGILLSDSSPSIEAGTLSETVFGDKAEEEDDD